jgi:hypothetical protein
LPRTPKLTGPHSIAANTISAGSDLTALFPRFITIRRGGYIAAIVALAMCPWNLLSSSSRFTTYLSAYSVFLSSIIGVMFCDYYFVRRGHFVVEELYSFDKRGRSWYTAGINWRAYAAYILGIVPKCASRAIRWGVAHGLAVRPALATPSARPTLASARTASTRSTFSSASSSARSSTTVRGFAVSAGPLTHHRTQSSPSTSPLSPAYTDKAGTKICALALSIRLRAD